MLQQSNSSLDSMLRTALSAYPSTHTLIDLDDPLNALEQLWQHAETHDDLALSLRCALSDASKRSISANLTPALLVGLVTVGTPQGRWTVEKALAHIAQVPEEYERGELLNALIAAVHPLPIQRVLAVVQSLTIHTQAGLVAELKAHLEPATLQAFAAELLRAIPTVEEGLQRIWVFEMLLPALGDTLLLEGLDFVARLHNEHWQQRALQGLIQRVRTASSPAFYTAIIARITGWDDTAHANALALLAPAVPEEYILALEQAARAIPTLELRGVALAALLPRLAEPHRAQLASEIISTAVETHECWWRARLLALTLPHLSETERAEPLALALAAVEQLSFASQCDFLPTLLPYLAEEERTSRCKALLDPLSDKPYDFGAASRMLAAHLPSGLQTSIVERAIKLTDPDAYESALAALAPHLTPDQAVAYLLSSCAFMNEYYVLPDTLLALSPQLPSTLSQEVQAAINTLEWQRRTEFVASVAPRLEPAFIQQVYSDVLAHDDAKERVHCLINLLPILPETQQPAARAEAMRSARAIESSEWRHYALLALAALVPAAEQPMIYGEALAAAQIIEDGYERTDLLVALLEHLPEPEQPRAYARMLKRSDERELVRRFDLERYAVLRLPAFRQQTLDYVRAITDAELRADGLLKLAPHLSMIERDAIYEELRANGCDALKMVNLAPYLSANQRQIIYEELRASTYQALNRLPVFSDLPPEKQKDVFETMRRLARASEMHNGHTWTMIYVGPYLPPNQRVAVYDEIAPDINHIYWHISGAAKQLHSYGASLPTAQQHAFYVDAIKAVAKQREEIFRPSVAKLCAHLPSALLSIALNTVRRREHRWEQAVPLAVIAAQLPEAAQADVYAEALDAAVSAPSDQQRAKTLAQLVPHLPTMLLPDTINAAHAITDTAERTFALAALLPHLPVEERAAVCAQVFTLSDGWVRAQVLEMIAPVVEEGLLPQALDSICGSSPGWRRRAALCAIAPRLHGELLVRALTFAATLHNVHENERAQVLAALAPALAQEDGHSLAQWHIALRSLASYGRAELLMDLRALLTWLLALTTPQQRIEIVDTLCDTFVLYP